MGLVKCSCYRYRLPLLTVVFIFIYILTPLSRDKIKLSNFTLVNFFEHNLSIKGEAESKQSKYSSVSICSHTADTRGPHQKVISYSLYGNLSRIDIAQKYFVPLMKTIDEIPQIYPGWIVRIYHNSTNKRELVSLLRSHVDLCNVTQIARNRKMGNLFAMTWRWLPLLDKMVDSLMSRDSDGRIIPREVEAVQEWLDSQHIFHIMRDHPAHCLFGFIMGGCWGVKISQARSEIAHAATEMFTHNHLQEYDYDQILLDKFIWPLAKNNVLAHDSYCCTKLQPTQPFPLQRKDRLFVGGRAIINSTRTEELGDMEECPPQCRQSNYVLSKWNFC